MTPEEEENWKKLRAANLGGSEIASLFDQSPFGLTKFKLWHIKKGNIPADDLSDNDRVMAGNFMEPAIAAWASQHWSDPLVKANVYVKHKLVVGMAATPDYFRAGTQYPVEIKNVDGLQFYKNWEAAGDVITDAPLGYVLQVLHTMDCLDEGEGKLVAGIGGNRLAQMVIQRREDIIETIHAAVADFWQSIQENKPPEPDYKADAAVIAKLRRKGNKTPVDMTENEALMALCVEYEGAKVWADSWKQEKQGIGAQIMQLCDGHNVITCGTHKISISDIPGSPEKIVTITPDMIGTSITLSKAKAGYPRLNVKDTEKKEPDGETDE